MTIGGWRHLFLTPRGDEARAWRLPVLLRGRRRWRMAILATIGLLHSIVAVVLALNVKAALDHLLLAGADSGSVLTTAGIAFVALGVSATLRWREFVEGERLAQSYIHAVRVAIFRHVLRLGEAGMAQTSRSAVLMRFTGDLTPIRLWISRGLSRGIVASIGVPITLVALLFIDPFIGAVIAASVLLTGVSALALGPALDKSTRRVRSRRTQVLKRAQERLGQLATIDSIGDTRAERRLFARKSDRLAKALVSRAGVVGVLRAVAEAGAALASLGAVLVGAALVGFSLVTPGAVVAAMLIAGLISPKVQDLTRAFEYWTGARISIEKQARLLALRPVGRRKGSSVQSRRLPQAVGHLRLRSAAYRDEIGAVSLGIAPGERLWLADGARPKVLAMLRLAAGILQPTTGRVLLDGVKLRNVHRRDVRQHIALISSEFELFRGSIRSNLTYGLHPDQAGDLDNFIEQYSLGPLMNELPGALDYLVGEADRQVTAGRRLVFGIIRARLAGARIIIVDLADAAPDMVDLSAIERMFNGFGGAVIWASRSVAPGPDFRRILLSDVLELPVTAGP